MAAADVTQVVVVLVGDRPRVGQVLRRQVVVVGDLHGREVAGGVGGRVAGHRGADDRVRAAVPPVPRRAARGRVGHVVDRGDAAAVLQVADERVLLGALEQRAGRGVAAAAPRPRAVQEHDRVVLREVRGREDPRVLVRVVAVRRPEVELQRRAAAAVLPGHRVAEPFEARLDDRPAAVDAVGVTEPGRAGVDQDLLALPLRLRAGRQAIACHRGRSRTQQSDTPSWRAELPSPLHPKSSSPRGPIRCHPRNAYGDRYPPLPSR